MTSPTSPILLYGNNICDKEISVGYDINFDDEASSGSWPCPPEDGLTYQPSNALSVFDGAKCMVCGLLTSHDTQNQLPC